MHPGVKYRRLVGPFILANLVAIDTPTMKLRSPGSKISLVFIKSLVGVTHCGNLMAVLESPIMVAREQSMKTLKG